MAPKMAPQGCARTMLNCADRPWGGPRRSQDRLGSILLSSCRSGSLFWPSWGRFGLVLGSFWGALGVVLVLFRHFSSAILPINPSTRRFNPSTHQPIDSTHQPINSSIQPINLSILYRRSMTFPRVYGFVVFVVVSSSCSSFCVR